MGHAYSIVNSPPYRDTPVSGKRLYEANADGMVELTDKTRSKDVLPAFCNPIMVTSISVALSIAD
jgi:hypothetical protein